jgi:hypothetical protein
MSARDELAAKLRSAAEALDRASQHCRIAADHIDAHEVTRMAAHALAARGDLFRGSDALDAAAVLHARHSEI